jgi:hypothetical protein
MAQELVNKISTAVAITDNTDPFQAFADAVAPQHILGKLLKFTKGDWVAGEGSEPVDKKGSFIVGMHALTTGWVRWREFKPVEHAMVSIGSRLLPPRRDELGDNDPGTWETDDRGDKRDPWQPTSYLPMVSNNDGEVFTFAASSKGGIEALGKLSRIYAAHRRSAPGQLPVVTLSNSGYQHSRRELGYIKTPLFVVTGWVPASQFNEMAALAGYDFLEGNEPAPTEIPAAPTAVVKLDNMDDDIPF